MLHCLASQSENATTSQIHAKYNSWFSDAAVGAVLRRLSHFSVKFLFTLPCDSQYSLYFGNIWEILKNTDAHIQA